MEKLGAIFFFKKRRIPSASPERLSSDCFFEILLRASQGCRAIYIPMYKDNLLAMSSATGQKQARLTTQAQGQQSEEIVHISSFAMVKNENNELLLAKRIRPEFTAGKWVFPSAIINFGEDPEVAVKRIVREQIGSDPKSVRLLQVQ